MIEQTTLHNILTWVIAVVLFIFQSLNYFIAWIKKYVKHGQKTTTVVTADTIISSESILNNKNEPENVITVQGLIQKHFDIPLIVAEDEPKVYNFIKSAQLLTSNEIRKEKTKIDQFMENLVDDSYVARGLGLITATVGRQSEFYLYSKYDNSFENIVIRLNGRNGEIGQITILSKNPTNIVEPKSIPMDYIYDKDRIKVTYTPFSEGVYTLTLVRNTLSICRSPYYISVEKSPTNSRSQIRLGTKKYKPVTKFAKSKHSTLETCDNSINVIEPSKPSICKNILSEPEKNSIRTDVMSIVTKFESNSIHFQKRVHKNTSSISEKSSETDMINEIPKYSNIPPIIETDNVHDNYFSDLNSPSIHSKTKSTDKNFWNDVDITYKNSKSSDINTIDFESERIKKPMAKLNEHFGITKDIPEVKNVSSTRLQPTNSVLVESLKIENLHDVEKHNQTIKTIELMDENQLIEKLLDPTTRIYESEIKCIDNEPCIQNEVSCFDDEDRKTVVVIDSNEIESNPNDTVIQQITDSAQYNINTPFASVITKITNSICEKCSIQVFKIISEFPRDINITHKNNSNEMRSSFETLLAQPISININIDNMFEQPISAKNEHDSEHLLTINPTKIKHIGTIDKDIKCSYLNEIEPIDNNSDELCSNINNMSKELMIKQNKHNSKIDEMIKDEISDHCIVPFAEHNTADKLNTVRKNNELSTNEIMKIKYSTTNEDNVLHSNQFNNNTIHKSDNKMEIQRQHLQKSSEHSIDLNKTKQFHENINKELNHISKESDKPLATSDLVTINYDKNTNYEFKINNVIIPDVNTNIQSSVINNIVLESKEVTLATTEYKSEDNEEQTNNTSYKNVALTSIQNENQKLMIEKSIEPVLTSFKNKMVEKITQLYLNRDLSNTDNTSTFETHDKHPTNNLHEIKINNNANNTELNTKCIETLTSQLKNLIDKNEISEIILDQQKTDSNHLLKYVENIIKTKINPSGLYAHTLGEIKLQTLVNTAMNHPNDQQIDKELKNMIIDNDTQDDKIKKINNDEIVQDIEAMLVETPSVTIIKNTDELKLPKNEVTVTTQCEIPLTNDFDTIEIENINTDSKQEMQTINVNENDTIVETNAVEIKALQNFQKSHNTEIITPIIELRPTLETRIMNTSELVTVEENSSKEIQTTIEIIDSINIPEETNAVEKKEDKYEYESVKLQFKENVIKIPHLVEEETLNEVVENRSTNISTKLNSTESVSMQAEIESPELTKVPSANGVAIERDIIYKLPPKAENIVINKPNSESIPTLNTQVSKNSAKVTIGINTSDPQISNTAITVLIPSKIPLIENNSFIPKLRILSTLNKLDAIEILTIPKYSAICDTKVTKRELQNTSKPTLSTNKFYMKDRKLEKIENIDETCIPLDTEIETLDLNKSGKITSILPISHDTLAETTVESKIEKNKLHSKSTTVNPKYKVTTLEPTVNEINCNNTKNETTIPISSKKHTEIESTPKIYPQSEPDKKVDEMLICTEAETPTVINTSTASLVSKIVVEFVTNKNKTPIEALEIIVHEQIEEDIVTVRETIPTMNSLVADMHEQVNIKNDGSDTYYVRSDDNVTNTGTKPRKSIGQNNVEKIIEKESPVPISTLREVVMENPKMNIVTVTSITSCTNSSTETIDVITDVEKVIEDESPSQINSLCGLVQGNMNININTENETLLPIESTLETIVEPKIENITEPEITSCTESSTEIIDIQFHAEKIVDEVLIDSLGEVMGENTNRNIVSESEKLLPIVSTEESILEPTVEDISVTTITSCTDFFTSTFDVQTVVEKVIEGESVSPNNSLSEVVVLNIDTDNKTLFQIDKITESVEEKKEKDGLMQTILPMKLTMESVKEPKVIEDITETEITSCTESSTKIIPYRDHAEKMFSQEAPPVPINFSEEEVDGKSKVIIDTETETHLPIVSTIESIEKPKLVEGVIETKIPYCTESSTEITDKQMDPDNVIEEPSPTPINFLSEIVGVKTKVHINTESEALLPMTNYVEEKEVIEETTEIVLPIQSAMEFIQEPKLEEDIIEIKIKSCTDSSTDEIQNYIKNVIEEESSTPINSLGVVEKNANDNIDKENEILLPIDSITGSMEEKKEKYGHIDPLLTMISTMEFIKEPKEVEDITVTEIKSCTNSSPVILEIQMEVEKVIEEVPPVLINSSSIIIGEKTKVNMDTEYETILLIKSTIGSIEEPEISEDIAQTKILSCTAPSNATVNVQTDVKKVIEEVSMAPINCSNEEVGGKSNLNIHTENETLLPFELTMETIAIPKKVEDITKTEISSCTDSCISTVDTQTDEEKRFDEVTPEPINSSRETNMDIDTGKETILPIKISTSSVEGRKAIERTTEIVLPIESIMEFKKEPNVVEDITKTEISSCTDSCISTVDTQTNEEKRLDEVTPEPINSSRETNMDIDTGKETILPIKISTSSVEDRKAIEGTTEIVLPIESTMEFKKEPNVVKDITVTEITPWTDSSCVIVETKIDVERVIDELSMVPINSFDEELGGKSKANIGTVNETILPIKTSTGSVEDRKSIEGTTENILLIEKTIEFEEESIVVEDINVTEITPCTDSSSGIVETKIVDSCIEKVIEEVPTVLINASCKILGEKTKVNMDTEYETIITIKSTIESVEEPNAVEDIIETEITSCTESSTENIMDVQSKKEKYMAKKSPAPINSLVEDVSGKLQVNFDTEDETFLPMVSKKESLEKELDEVSLEPINSSDKVVAEETNMNIDTENETILPIKTSTCPVEDRKAIEIIVLPIEFTVELKKEKKEIVKDMPGTETTPCTDSCILTVDDQTDVEKELDEVTLVLFDSSGKIIGEKTKVNMDTEYETILPSEASYESIEELKVVEDITETEITSCTESSTESMMDVQTNNEKYMAKKSPAPINSSVEEVGGILKVNIDSEDEKLLPIELTMESVAIPKTGEGITETEIVSCTDSCTSTVDAQTDVKKKLDEVTPVLFNSSGKIIGEKTKVSMDTEYETILPIEASYVSIEKPKVVEGITETEIASCTESSTESMMDIQTNEEKYMAKKTLAPINSSVGEVGGKLKVNIDSKDEKLLPIASTKESIEETKIEPTVVTDTEILSCMESSTIIMNHQNHTEKTVDKVPINYLSEVMGENINVNIVTENKTHLPIGSTMEAVEETNIVEDITEIEKRLSTGSSSIKLDTTIHVEKVIEEVPSVLIDPSDKVENPKVIDTEYETILLIESTIESIPESEIYEDITKTEILSCTEPSTGNLVAQTDVEKVIGEVSLTLINSSDKVVREEMNVNIDNENETLLPINTSTRYVKDKTEIYTLIETLLPIESTVESIKAQKVENITEPKFTSCTESSTEIIDNQNQTKKIVDQKHLVLINSSDVVVGGNTNVNIDIVTETLLPVGSTTQSIEVSKEVEDIKETEKIPSTGSFPITVDIHTDVEKIIDKKSPSLINSFGELVQKNMNRNINTENETLLPYELTIESIEESNVVDDRTEIEITSYTEPLTKIINSQFHEEKIIDKVKLNSLGEVMEENTNMKIVTESETLLSISSTKESILEPKVEEDITVTTKTSCADSSTLTVDVQIDVKKVIEEKSLSQIKSLDKVVQGNTNVSINAKNETLLQIHPSNSSMEEMKEIDELIETLSPMKSNIESIKVSEKIEDIEETEKISFTDSSILTKDFQTDVDIVIEKKSPAQINFLFNIVGENTKVNNDIENETILPIESTEEITVDPKVEADITETAITSCTDSSTVTVDIQTDVEKVIEEVSPVPIHSSGEVVGESTKLYIDTENEKLLQIDTSITAVKAVLEEKMIENEYLTPNFSALLDVEKRINVIIDSKTKTLFPIGTNTTFVSEPNVVGRVSENENAPLIDSSITSIKQQIKVDTETEIETLLLIDNLTESIKEQIVEKITENKTPTLIDSLAEMVGEGSKVNIVTDNQTLLTINTSSKIVDDQIVKNGIKNETQTPIVNVTEEQTKVNIETNNKTITPINIFTTSIEEQLNVEYLCENENTTHIDSVPTMIKNQTKIDIETENETLLSIENSSFEEQMDEVDKIIQNNFLVDFSAGTELMGYEILTDTETETSTSIDTLNTTVDRQTMKENFKEIESRIRIDTSTAFEEEQKSVEHITVKENVLSIGTSTASVEEEIQVEEVIENECATLISYSTVHDVASLEEPKVIKNDTTAMRSSVTVVEEQNEVAAAEVVIDTCKKSLDKTMIEKGTRHNETPKPIDTLVIAADKHTDLKKVAENEMPILVNTSTKSEEKQITTEKFTENETITIIACEALPKIETNEFEAESENKASILVNNSASITMKQTEAEDVTETTLQNDDIIFYRNTKTNLIGTQNKTENSDNPNDCYLKFGESSKMHCLEDEDNLQRKSYGIQKLEMSVQRMKTSDEDYYEKTFVQLEQTEKISKVDKVNVDGENKTIIDDKLYTVNESDLNSILCASSLEEALTLLDSKIKFKFKHKKSSSKINSMEYIPKIQTSDSNSSGVNPNFTDARKFFKEIEKKSKK